MKMSGPQLEEDAPAPAAPDFLPSYPTVDSYSQGTLRQILVSTKHSNQLPGDKREDWDYYSTFPGFRRCS